MFVFNALRTRQSIIRRVFLLQGSQTCDFPYDCSYDQPKHYTNDE